MRQALLLWFLFLSTATLFAGMQPANAAPCRPPESAAMMTGPVYESISAECSFIDAINRRDAAAAARILNQAFEQVDFDGAIESRSALLTAIAGGRFGIVAMDPRDIHVPFSSGSANVLVSTWTFDRKKHRVTDVFFCDVSHACVYRLIAEQLTIVAP